MTEPARLPIIVASRTIDANCVEIDLCIDAGLFWFQGHFPAFPILPGVVQLDWALAFARERLGLDCPSAQVFQVKYKAGIFPGDRLTLTLGHRPDKQRLAFDYRRDGQICSSGQVTITP
jgi:3-hydroxymyristoyl/3-hydroxydecanoyl-(acyl carrier protein) dehydratase